MNSLRHAMSPHSSVLRGFLLGALAVMAIIVGLLAMHSFAPIGHADVGGAAAAGHHHSEMISSEQGNDALGGHCQGPCSPDHAMTTTACILALLVPVLILGVTRVVTAWRAVLRVSATAHHHLAALPFAAPPSLHDLSISRT